MNISTTSKTSPLAPGGRPHGYGWPAAQYRAPNMLLTTTPRTRHPVCICWGNDGTEVANFPVSPRRDPVSGVPPLLYVIELLHYRFERLGTGPCLPAKCPPLVPPPPSLVCPPFFLHLLLIHRLGTLNARGERGVTPLFPLQRCAHHTNIRQGMLATPKQPETRPPVKDAFHPPPPGGCSASL